MSEAERAPQTPPGDEAPTPAQGRSEQKLATLLATAARLMAEQGFAQTSIRNVAKETGFSLAGMYYYFENKEDLLYQIQQRTFAALLAEQEQALAAAGDAVARLRRLIRNHLDYFTRHASELKVCTFEMQSLQGERYESIAQLRRQNYRCLAGVVGEILGHEAERGENGIVRHYTLFIFGMLNWIFMWFDPERDVPADRLGDEMIALVLPGLLGQGAGKR